MANDFKIAIAPVKFADEAKLASEKAPQGSLVPSVTEPLVLGKLLKLSVQPKPYQKKDAQGTPIDSSWNGLHLISATFEKASYAPCIASNFDEGAITDKTKKDTKELAWLWDKEANFTLYPGRKIKVSQDVELESETPVATEAESEFE